MLKIVLLLVLIERMILRWSGSSENIISCDPLPQLQPISYSETVLEFVLFDVLELVL